MATTSSRTGSSSGASQSVGTNPVGPNASPYKSPKTAAARLPRPRAAARARGSARAPVVRAAEQQREQHEDKAVADVAEHHPEHEHERHGGERRRVDVRVARGTVDVDQRPECAAPRAAAGAWAGRSSEATGVPRARLRAERAGCAARRCRPRRPTPRQPRPGRAESRRRHAARPPLRPQASTSRQPAPWLRGRARCD